MTNPYRTMVPPLPEFPPEIVPYENTAYLRVVTSLRRLLDGTSTETPEGLARLSSEARDESRENQRRFLHNRSA
jgi:hypothetical protein